MNQQNIDIFNDTLDFIKNNDTLNKSIFDSIKNTILYKNKVLVENKKTKNNYMTNFKILVYFPY